MAERVLALPLVIVATALGQVVEARLANHARDRASGCVQFFARVSMFLALFSLLVAAVVLAVAPLVVPFILGSKWTDVAAIMQLLLPMLITRLIASPMSKSLVVAQWAAVNLWLDVGRAILVCFTLAACRVLGASLNELVFWTAAAFAVVYVATWICALLAAKSIDAVAD